MFSLSGFHARPPFIVSPLGMFSLSGFHVLRIDGMFSHSGFHAENVGEPGVQRLAVYEGYQGGTSAGTLKPRDAP